MKATLDGQTPAAAAAVPSRDSSQGRATGGTKIAGRWALPGSLIVMFVVFALRSDAFLTAANLNNMLDQAVVPLLLAGGVTFVLAVGEFDLAFPAVIGMSGAVVIVLMAQHEVGWQTAVALAPPLGIAVGALVGFLVTFGQASSFIITLAVGSALVGVELAITGDQTIYENIPAGFGELSSRMILGVHQPVLFAVIVVLLLFVLMHGTRFGRHAQSLGGNAQAALLAGVRVRRVRIACFVITAVLASVAGVILASRASSYYPNSAGNLLLTAYTAVFLGATAGRSSAFTVWGSVLGVLWVIVLQTGLTLGSAPTWLASLIQGSVLALAVILGSRGKGTT